MTTPNDPVSALSEALRGVERRVMGNGTPCYCNEHIHGEDDHLPSCRAARSLLASPSESTEVEKS